MENFNTETNDMKINGGEGPAFSGAEISATGEMNAGVCSDKDINTGINIVKIQRFSTHDGPGVRTVVFMKGCPLRCKWCHNPETQSADKQILFTENLCIGCGLCASVCENHAHRFESGIAAASDSIGVDNAEISGSADEAGGSESSGGFVHIFDPSLCKACLKCAEICPANALESAGKTMTVSEVIKVVLRDRAFYGENGGITLSGGEPMFQPDAAIALLSAARKNGISTAIETCGYFPKAYIRELCAVTDFFLWDMKDGVSDRHREYTGVKNERIAENLLLADSYAKSVLIRCIMVRKVNMDIANFDAIAALYRKMKHCSGVELIPYHAYGGSKAKQLGKLDNGMVEWIPTDAEMLFAAGYLRDKGVNVTL